MPAPAQQRSTNSTHFADLSPAQAQFLAALAQGLSISSAAESAGVHRTTTYNWYNTSPEFAAAFNEAREAYADKTRAETEDLTALALKTLRDLMEDPNASPSVRLKAALAVLKRHGMAVQAAAPPNAEPQLMQELLNIGKGLDIPPEPGTPPRNASCPCGSGLKYKRCCGVEAPPHVAQQAA